MGKALLALVVTVIVGLLATAFGYDAMNGFSEVGAVVSIAVMGAFIIYFQEKHK